MKDFHLQLLQWPGEDRRTGFLSKFGNLSRGQDLFGIHAIISVISPLHIGAKETNGERTTLSRPASDSVESAFLEMSESS